MKTHKDYYPSIVLGSTFAGLGAAYANREDTLVIDRTGQAGYEYINSYCPGTGWTEAAQTEEGRKLKEELFRRNILSEDGRLHIPALAPVLFNRIIEDGLNVLLLTEIVNIESRENGFEVLVYNNSGYRRIKADRILDTRTESLSPERIIRKSINAVLHCEGKANTDTFENRGNVQFVEGRFPGEIIVKLNIDVNDDWPTARRKLHEFWLNRPQEWQEWTIAAVATAFDIQAGEGAVTISDSWSLLASAAYRNPLAAFEAGLLYIERGEKYAAG